jgi:hypothetical protein
VDASYQDKAGYRFVKKGDDAGAAAVVAGVVVTAACQQSDEFRMSISQLN